MIKIGPPSDIKELYTFLHPFYKKERYNSTKAKRLSKFMDSDLAKKLWDIKNPGDISSDIYNLWIDLAKTMGGKSKRYYKTICFSIKCVGLLLMKYDNFIPEQFYKIPIPVDSRITKITKKLGFCNKCNGREIRNVWSDILSNLNKKRPVITVVHLDSFLWQIVGTDDIQGYCNKIGITNICPDIERIWILIKS